MRKKTIWKSKDKLRDKLDKPNATGWLSGPPPIALYMYFTPHSQVYSAIKHVTTVCAQLLSSEKNPRLPSEKTDSVLLRKKQRK